MLRRNGVAVRGRRASTIEGADGETRSTLILAGEIDLVVNTPSGRRATRPRSDGYEIRTAAVAADIPCITTVQGAAAAVRASRR